MKFSSNILKSQKYYIHLILSLLSLCYIVHNIVNRCKNDLHSVELQLNCTHYIYLKLYYQAKNATLSGERNKIIIK